MPRKAIAASAQAAAASWHTTPQSPPSIWPTDEATASAMASRRAFSTRRLNRSTSALARFEVEYAADRGRLTWLFVWMEVGSCRGPTRNDRGHVMRAEKTSGEPSINCSLDIRTLSPDNLAIAVRHFVDEEWSAYQSSNKRLAEPQTC